MSRSRFIPLFFATLLVLTMGHCFAECLYAAECESCSSQHGSSNSNRSSDNASDGQAPDGKPSSRQIPSEGDTHRSLPCELRMLTPSGTIIFQGLSATLVLQKYTKIIFNLVMQLRIRSMLCMTNAPDSASGLFQQIRAVVAAPNAPPQIA